jgi:spermidine synthase
LYFIMLTLALNFFVPKTKKLDIPYAIFTTGLLGMAFDLIIVFVYQSFYGYVYHHIALLITAFMSGLTLGGWLMTKRLSVTQNKKFSFILFEVGLILFSLAIIPILIFLQKTVVNLSFVFFLLSAVLGFLVGSEFPLANSLYRWQESTQTAGMLYAFDLFGSWIGALFVSVILIPIIGLVHTCVFLAALKLSSLIFVYMHKNN